MGKNYFLIACYITGFASAVNANSPWDPRTEKVLVIKEKKKPELHKYVKGTFGYGRPESMTAVSDMSAKECGNMKFGEYYFGDIAVGSNAFFDELVSGIKLRNELMFHFAKRKADNNDVKLGNADVSAKLDLKSYALLVNTYLDLGKVGQVSPFVGGGLGLAYHSLGGNIAGMPVSSTPSLVTFAWNLTGGLTVPVNDRFKVEFAYRYMDLGRVSAFTRTRGEFTGASYKQGFEAPTRNQQYMVSWRYHF